MQLLEEGGEEGEGEGEGEGEEKRGKNRKSKKTRGNVLRMRVWSAANSFSVLCLHLCLRVCLFVCMLKRCLINSDFGGMQ